MWLFHMYSIVCPKCCYFLKKWEWLWAWLNLTFLKNLQQVLMWCNGSCILLMSTVFSMHQVWTEGDACHEYNGLIVKLYSGWICLTANAHTLQCTFHYGRWLQDLDGLGSLHYGSGHGSTCYDFNFAFLVDRRDVLGIFSTRHLKLPWICSQKAKKM